jgi:hypothetical protein
MLTISLTTEDAPKVRDRGPLGPFSIGDSGEDAHLLC